MAELKGQNPGGAGLVFAAHNNHSPQCGLPPRVRNIDNPGLYYGYFENRFGEQFVFVFDRATKTGTVAGGDVGWGEPKAFTLGLLEEALLRHPKACRADRASRKYRAIRLADHRRRACAGSPHRSDR